MRTKAKPMPSGDELFKGEVTLGMETQGSTRHMLQFLSQVAENPSIQLVQMVGGYQGATVWLILRQPMHLTQMLSMMGASQRCPSDPSRTWMGPTPP